MIHSDKISYIVILVIIIIILFIVNKQTLFPIYEGITTPGTAPAPAPAISEADQTVANKNLTGTVSQMTFNAQLQAVQSKINTCNNLVAAINAKIPASINDIKIGEVSQTETVDDVGVTINGGTMTTTSPITNLPIQTGEWTLNVVLPAGQTGATGIQGIQGPPGKNGDQGAIGTQGKQGPWGECSA
jgi:hypothetical protein